MIRDLLAVAMAVTLVHARINGNSHRLLPDHPMVESEIENNHDNDLIDHEHDDHEQDHDLIDRSMLVATGSGSGSGSTPPHNLMPIMPDEDLVSGPGSGSGLGSNKDEHDQGKDGVRKDETHYTDDKSGHDPNQEPVPSWCNDYEAMQQSTCPGKGYTLNGIAQSCVDVLMQKASCNEHQHDQQCERHHALCNAPECEAHRHCLREVLVNTGCGRSHFGQQSSKLISSFDTVCPTDSRPGHCIAQSVSRGIQRSQEGCHQPPEPTDSPSPPWACDSSDPNIFDENGTVFDPTWCVETMERASPCAMSLDESLLESIRASCDRIAVAESGCEDICAGRKLLADTIPTFSDAATGTCGTWAQFWKDVDPSHFGFDCPTVTSFGGPLCCEGYCEDHNELVSEDTDGFVADCAALAAAGWCHTDPEGAPPGWGSTRCCLTCNQTTPPVAGQGTCSGAVMMLFGLEQHCPKDCEDECNSDEQHCQLCAPGQPDRSPLGCKTDACAAYLATLTPASFEAAIAGFSSCATDPSTAPYAEVARYGRMGLMMMYADAAGKCGLPGEWKEDAWFGASNSSIYNGGGGSSSVSNGGEGVECTTNEACQSGLFCASECFSGNGCPKNQMATALAGYCQPCHECHGDFDAFTGYCTDYCSSHGSSVDNGGTTHAAGSTDGTANATASSGDDSASFVGSATCPEEHYKAACEPAAGCFDHAGGCNAADGSFWFPEECAQAAAVCAPCFPNSACAGGADSGTTGSDDGTTHAAGSIDSTANATASSGDDSASFVGDTTHSADSNNGTAHAAGSTDGTANATASSGDDSGSFVGSATCPEEYYKTACEPAAECFDHAMGCNAADGSFWFPDHCAEAAAVCAPCFPNSACEDAGYMSPDYNYPDDYNATTATGPDTDAAMPDMSGIDVGAPYNYNYDYDSIPDGSAGNAPTAVDGAGTPDAADGS